MTFRNGSISLRAKGGTTDLTSRLERFDRPSIDKRFAALLDKHAEAGKNPAFYHKDTMKIASVSESVSDRPLVYNHRPKKAYNLSNKVIRARHTHLVEIDCSDNPGALRQNINVMLDPNRHDQKRNEALVWVHPGIYRTNSGKLRVFISNFSDVDAVIPSGKFIGYL